MAAAPFDIAVPSLSRMSGIRHPSGELLFRSLAWACLGGLTVSAMLLAARRADGMLGSPLSGAPLFVAGMLIASLTLLAQWPHLRRIVATRIRRIQAADVAAFGAPSAIAVLLAAVITLPGTSLGGAVLLWLPLVAGQAVLVLLHRRRAATVYAGSATGTTNELVALPERDLRSSFIETPEAASDETSDEYLAGDVTQRWARRTVDGADVLEGMARAYFSAGVRAANLHVGICPPFASVPEVFAETTDGPAATVKVAETLPFGLRLEVRLSQPCDLDSSVVVVVVARA